MPSKGGRNAKDKFFSQGTIAGWDDDDSISAPALRVLASKNLLTRRASPRKRQVSFRDIEMERTMDDRPNARQTRKPMPAPAKTKALDRNNTGDIALGPKERSSPESLKTSTSRERSNTPPRLGTARASSAQDDMEDNTVATPPKFERTEKSFSIFSKKLQTLEDSDGRIMKPSKFNDVRHMRICTFCRFERMYHHLLSCSVC